MLQRLLVALAFLMFDQLPLSAHGPTPQKAEESVTIAAAPEQVWKVVADFAAIGGWHPLVKKVSATGGDAAGAERVLTLETGDITEGLDESDAAARRLSWRLSKENVDALPVSFYTATIEVKPAAGGSQVDWSARFYRADTSNFPPDDRNDEAAIAAMNDFIRKGLDGLKAKAAAP